MELINALESIRAGIASKELIEQSTSFLFSDNKIFTYNDEICAITKTELDIEGAVEAATFLKIFSKIKDDEVSIGIKDNEIRIKGKKFQTGINFDEEIKLPIDNAPITEDFIEVPENFTRLAKLACLTASKSVDEPLITFVHITNEFIESCDNERITICTLDLEEEVDVLVSAKSLMQILMNNTITGINVDDTWIHFITNEEVILSCRLQEEEYVDLHEHIPEEEGKVIELPSQIKEILDRAEIFSKEESTTGKFVTIELADKKLKVSSQNNRGWFKEKTKTKYTGPNISFSINADFLKDILSISNTISVVDTCLLFRDEYSVHLVQLETENE